MIFTILIVLLPILFQFKSPISVLTLGEFLLLPFLAIEFVKRILVKKKNTINGIPVGLAWFYIVPIFTTLIASFSSFFSWPDAITVIARIIFYFAVIIVALNSFKSKIGIKLYICVSIASCLYLILQVLFYRAFAIYLPTLYDVPNLLFSNSTISDTLWYYHMFGFRPSSVFTEPSYFATYIAPCVAIVLFSNKKGFIFTNDKYKKIILALFLTACLLLSTSSLGIAYCAVVWSFFFLSKKSNKLFGTGFKILFAAVFVFLIAVVLSSNLFTDSINRFLKGASIGQRLLRGFVIYSRMDFFEKIYGVGLNNVQQFVVFKNIVTQYDEENLNYTVTITNRLIATGIIGTLALIWFCAINYTKHRTPIARNLVLLLFISFIFANGEYTYVFPFYLILINCFEPKTSYCLAPYNEHRFLQINRYSVL